jgi:hypothetical protein
MKSGIAIVEMWMREFHFELPCEAKRFLVEAIEAGLQEAYQDGQHRMIELAKRKIKDEEY